MSKIYGGTGTIALAKRWVDLFEGSHFIVPPPVISRTEVLSVSRDYLTAISEKELWQRRYEWLRDSAIFDGSWVDLTNEEFLARVDENIAADLA